MVDFKDLLAEALTLYALKPEEYVKTKIAERGRKKEMAWHKEEREAGQTFQAGESAKGRALQEKLAGEKEPRYVTVKEEELRKIKLKREKNLPLTAEEQEAWKAHFASPKTMQFRFED